MKHRRILALFMAVLMLLGMMHSALAFMDDQGNILDWPSNGTFDTGVPAHTHDWKGYEPGREPTCTEPGYHYAYCTICDSYSEWNYIEVSDPPLGHDWSGGREVVTKQPTCTETGTKTQYCGRCGATQTASIPALGHDWGAWQDTY